MTGPQNSKSVKYWANDEPGFMIGLVLDYQDTAKNLTKSQFAENLQNGSNIYELVLFLIFSMKLQQHEGLKLTQMFFFHGIYDKSKFYLELRYVSNFLYGAAAVQRRKTSLSNYCFFF